MKEHKLTGKRSVLASGKPVQILNLLDDKDISERNIDYAYYYEEAYKIINPIKLGISPNQKGNAKNKTLSGKALLKRTLVCIIVYLIMKKNNDRRTSLFKCC